MGETVPGRVSVIIPGRKELYFQQTVDSALERATGDVEIVAIVDEEQPPTGPLVVTDPRVRLIVLETAIGQRAAYNLGVRECTGEYVMKIDAHCLLSPGYDEALKAVCGDEMTVIPEMRRLDPRAWAAKPRGKTWFMFFGLDMYCHYWREYRKRPAAQGDVAEVMTGQGSCWFCKRAWSEHIGLLNEAVGSWGNVGIEVSLRTWLCGGTQVVAKKVWQAHYFRRDEGGFPYALTGRDVARAHNYTREHYYFNDNAFEHQVRPFSWLIEKFAPVPGWEAYLADQFETPRVIVYYTDSQLEDTLASAVRKQLRRVAGPIPIISVSQTPLNFGQNICVGEKPKVYRSMYEQLLAGLEAAPEGSIVYCCEHDVFYHPSHFAFLPTSREHAYFNTQRYYYKRGVGSFLKARGKRALSQCVAYREMLIDHCRERLALWDQGIENRMKIRYYNFESERPNVDVRHGDNLTPDGDYKRKWMRGLSDEGVVVNLPGWGRPAHFEGKVGYREPVPFGIADDAAAYVLKRFGRWLPQVSPVRVPQMKRDELARMFAALGYQRGAEIGVREGRHSQYLCKTVKGLSLLCVDLWGAYYHFTEQADHDRHFEEAQARLKRYDATFLRMPSMEAAREVEDGSLDFVYIDADHRFDWVMEDIITWSRKVRPGGMVTGHDYYRFRNSGVVQAVDVYTQMHGIAPWFITDEKKASFFWVKGEDG